MRAAPQRSRTRDRVRARNRTMRPHPRPALYPRPSPDMPSRIGARFCAENRPDQTPDSHGAKAQSQTSVAAAGFARSRLSPAAPWRAPAATPRPHPSHTAGPCRPPGLHLGRLTPTAAAPGLALHSATVPVFRRRLRPFVPRMRLCGAASARHCRAEARREARTGPHAERPGPRRPSALFPARPGLAGRALRALAAPGPDPARACLRRAGFDSSDDAAFASILTRGRKARKNF